MINCINYKSVILKIICLGMFLRLKMQLIVTNVLQIYLRWQKNGHKPVEHLFWLLISMQNRAVNMMLLQIM